MVKSKTVVVDVNVGRPYSDENKLLRPMLGKLRVRAKYFLGDAYYGGVEILKEVRQLNMEAIVPVRDTVHTRVRNPHRLWTKKNYEKRRRVYKRNRFRVEQVIGIVKNCFGDRDWVRDYHVASLYVLARFALYNLMLLLRLLLLWLNLLKMYLGFFLFSFHASEIFPTGSPFLDRNLPLN